MSQKNGKKIPMMKITQWPFLIDITPRVTMSNEVDDTAEDCPHHFDPPCRTFSLSLARFRRHIRTAEGRKSRRTSASDVVACRRVPGRRRDMGQGPTASAGAVTAARRPLVLGLLFILVREGAARAVDPAGTVRILGCRDRTLPVNRRPVLAGERTPFEVFQPAAPA